MNENKFSIFLSIVFVSEGKSSSLREVVIEIEDLVSRLTKDYEIIVVDNSSEDGSLSILKEMTGETGIPNLQVFALTKAVDTDTAYCAGLEHALGDFVLLIDPWSDDIKFLPSMLQCGTSGSDVVFANNQIKALQSIAYSCAHAFFNFIYKRFNGIHLQNEAPEYRLLNRSVVNFILQHSRPAITYRHLPATGGFEKVNLDYRSPPKILKVKQLAESVERGVRLLVSTTNMPMRIVTSISLFGALINLLYSFYVLIVGLFGVDVAAGWVSLSLQQSGMFFLISLVLMVLGEYMLHMTNLSNDGPAYHVGREFTSSRMTRRERLNIEDVSAPHTMEQAVARGAA